MEKGAWEPILAYVIRKKEKKSAQRMNNWTEKENMYVDMKFIAVKINENGK